MMEDIAKWVINAVDLVINYKYIVSSIVVSLIAYIVGGAFTKEAKKSFWIGLLAFFITWILIITVISRPTSYHYKYKLSPFWSYIMAFKKKKYSLLLENALNCILFVPYGACFANIYTKKSYGKLLVEALAFSYLIEFLQLFLRRGIFELFDDPIHNSLGALVAYFFVYKIKEDRGNGT